MQTLRVTNKPYSVLKFTMLSTRILVHCAVKSHVYHVKYTDFK